MNVRNDLPDHKLVVGCTRDSQIHTGIAAFQLLASGLFDKFITLAEAKFMAQCNVGDAWVTLASCTPIYGIDENDTPCFVEGGIAAPKSEPEIFNQQLDDPGVGTDQCAPGASEHVMDAASTVQ